MTIYSFLPLIATVLFWLLIVSATLRLAAQQGGFSDQPSTGMVFGALILVFSWLLSGALVPLTNLPVILINQMPEQDLYWAMAKYTILHWAVVIIAMVVVTFLSHYITQIATGINWRTWTYGKPNVSLLIGMVVMLGLSLLIRESLMPVFHQLTPSQSLPFIR